MDIAEDIVKRLYSGLGLTDDQILALYGGRQNLSKIKDEDILFEPVRRILLKGYSFKNNTLLLRTSKGETISPVNFTDTRSNGYMILVFEFMFNYWKKHKFKIDRWEKAIVPRKKILDHVKKRFPDKNEDWLKSTISHIRGRLRATPLADFVKIGNFNSKNSKHEGYPISFKSP